MSESTFNHYDHALAIECPTCHAKPDTLCRGTVTEPTLERQPLHITRYRVAYALYQQSLFIREYEMKIVQLLACTNCGRVAVSTEKHKIADGSMDRECIQGKFEAVTPLTDTSAKVTLPKEPTA